jgi:type I restriction enzyme, S subunit
VSELPRGWEWGKLEDLTLDPKSNIVDGPFGSNLKASEYVENGIPIVRLQNINRNFFIEKNIKFIRHEKANLLKRHSFIKGDIIITKLGDPLGKACLVPDSIEEGIIVADVVRVRPDERFSSKQYLIYLINSQVVSNQLLAEVKGTTRPRVNLNHIRQLQIPIAPLNEQHRIVAKLDSLFARSRHAREELERIPKLCDRYKQAVLAAAFRGDLTADWRQNIASACTTISLSKVCITITDGDHQAPPKVEKGIPFITISAINDGSLNLSKATRFVSSSYFESRSPHRKPAQGDILFSVTGSIGIPVIINTCEPFIFQRHIAILKVNRELILEKYLLYILGSEQIQKQALDVATGTAQLTIPLGGLRNFKIPFPTLEEQKEIVQRIEKLFKTIDLMRQEHKKASKLCDRLEQATLTKAFRGELVPQDPNDEPASVLLKRIRAERQEDSPKGKKAKR